MSTTTVILLILLVLFPLILIALNIKYAKKSKQYTLHNTEHRLSENYNTIDEEEKL